MTGPARYPPDLYLAVHDGNPGDVYFYRRACTEGRDVLELGCGAGRVSCALAADGLDVAGVERDRELLALAPSCGARFVEADMRRVDLGRRFDRIIAPYNALYCTLDEDELVDTLAQARAHARDGALLVFDGWAADRFHAEADPEAVDEPERVKTVRARGFTWDVYEHSHWDRERQRIDACYRHVPREGGEAVEATIAQRYLLGDQVGPMLSRAGFELLALLGSFDDEAFDEDSEHLIAVGVAI
ncbi:MAG: class I SAM-dependent methyltransferase [Polyangiales bacterium]